MHAVHVTDGALIANRVNHVMDCRHCVAGDTGIVRHLAGDRSGGNFFEYFRLYMQQSLIFWTMPILIYYVLCSAFVSNCT